MRLSPRPIAAMAVLAAPWAAGAAPPTTDDRIAVSASGATLSGTDGGEGLALAYLHNFDPDKIVGIAVEHQHLADAHWTFGSANGSYSRDLDGAKYSLYGEVHEGSGDDAGKPFHYRIETAGIYGTYLHRLSVQFEDKQIDVETTKGNLPKLGVSYVWNPLVQTSVSYSYSITGNLGTRLTGARLDLLGPAFNVFGGVAFGQASPVIILNLQSNLVIPGRQLHEGYIGVSKSFPRIRSDLSMNLDYQDLSGLKHAILTLNYIVHVGPR